MEINKNLSIVIPTYNRADFLDYSLEVHIPMLKEYGIEIAIFDNASTDNTQEIVSKWMKEYDYLTYHKNETNIGPDANFEKALKYPDSEYVWLLGDTYMLTKQGINYFLEKIKSKKYDAFVFNLANKLNNETKDYTDSNLLLSDLGALMTCLSCLIFSKELIDRANFLRYHNSYYIQTGIIFEDISNKNFLIHWVQFESVNALEHPTLKKRNWSQTKKVFDIACVSWTNFVMSLPSSYKLENKMKCIMDFGKVSGIFSLPNIILLRARDLLNLKIYNKYKKLFYFTVSYPKFLFLLLFIPRFFIMLGIRLIIRLFTKDKEYVLKSINKEE